MKKTLLIIFAVVFILFPLLSQALCDSSGGKGFVPCGQSAPGSGVISCPCEIGHIFEMIGRVYHFIVWNLATPLAILAVLVGGILLMVSSGNPGLAGRGKSILTIAIIGLVLVFLSYLIIDTLLFALTGSHLG